MLNRQWVPTHAASRIFTTGSRLSKNESTTRTVQNAAVHKTEADESVKPETVQKEKAVTPAIKQDSFLAEQTVSNKEQRKADWAIIKDMARYLWPRNDFGTRFRVGLSVALLVGAKVVPHPILLGSSAHVSIDSLLGPQCTNTILFQKHCRLYEY